MNGLQNEDVEELLDNDSPGSALVHLMFVGFGNEVRVEPRGNELLTDNTLGKTDGRTVALNQFDLFPFYNLLPISLVVNM